MDDHEPEPGPNQATQEEDHDDGFFKKRAKLRKSLLAHGCPEESLPDMDTIIIKPHPSPCVESTHCPVWAGA